MVNAEYDQPKEQDLLRGTCSGQQCFSWQAAEALGQTSIAAAHQSALLTLKIPSLMMLEWMAATPFTVWLVTSARYAILTCLHPSYLNSMSAAGVKQAAEQQARKAAGIQLLFWVCDMLLPPQKLAVPGSHQSSPMCVHATWPACLPAGGLSCNPCRPGMQWQPSFQHSMNLPKKPSSCSKLIGAEHPHIGF